MGTKKNGIYSFDNWLIKIEMSVRNETATRVFQNSHKGKTSLMDQIMSEHPTYLHHLWHHATNLLGDNATFKKLAKAMNLQSTVEEIRPSIRLTKWTLHRWFVKNKEKEK